MSCEKDAHIRTWFDDPRMLLNWKASITMSLSLCPLHFLAEENTTEASHGIGLDLSFDGVFPTAQKDVIVASVN
jgi:hypothetical protein